MRGRRRLTTEEFVLKAKYVHGVTYDYSCTIYEKGTMKVTIICKEHGSFTQYPGNHLQGRGCKKCTFLNDYKFKDKSKKVHYDKYDYTKSKCNKSTDKVIIICPIHGEFSQSASSHMNGNGCLQCARESHEGGWSYSQWYSTAHKSKYFDSFKVYIIRCFNEKEEFYKIGRTFQTLDRRFHSSLLMPYRYETVNIIESDYLTICKLEQKLKNENKQFKYKPIISFCGAYECFTSIRLNNL